MVHDENPIVIELKVIKAKIVGINTVYNSFSDTFVTKHDLVLRKNKSKYKFI